MSSRYERIAHIGGGAFGEVWEAIDRERDRRVALKVFHRLEDARAPWFSAVAAIDHPHLVRLFDHGEDRGEGFHAMELVDGATPFLRHVRAPRSPPNAMRATLPLAFGAPVQEGNVSAFSPIDATELARLRAVLPALLSAVAALHAAGFVHRDLEPSNVVVDRGGRLVVVDYGLLAPIGAPPDDDRLAVAAYAPPERAAIAPSIDAYAIGVMLFEALTGALPFDGSAHDVVLRKRTVSAPSPSFVVPLPEAARDLDEWCTRLLHREPSERATITAMLAAMTARR